MKKKRFSTLRTERGATLMSVMIVAGSLIVLAAIGAQAFNDRLKANARIQDRMVYIDLMERIRLATLGVDSCTFMVTNGGAPILTLSSPATLMLNQLEIGRGTELITVGGAPGITRIQFFNAAVLPTTHDVSGTVMNHHRLRLEVEGTLATGGNNVAFLKTFFMDALVDAADRVTSCYRGQENEKIACEVMAGVGGYLTSPARCVMPANGITTGSCPAGQCIYGFDGNNQRLCRAETTP